MKLKRMEKERGIKEKIEVMREDLIKRKGEKK